MTKEEKEKLEFARTLIHELIPFFYKLIGISKLCLKENELLDDELSLSLSDYLDQKAPEQFWKISRLILKNIDGVLDGESFWESDELEEKSKDTKTDIIVISKSDMQSRLEILLMNLQMHNSFYVMLMNMFEIIRQNNGVANEETLELMERIQSEYKTEMNSMDNLYSIFAEIIK